MNTIQRNKYTFDESNVIFVSDVFTDEYSGGAELTTEALFETSPYKTFKLKSNELSGEHIQNGMQKIWVFFNFSQMHPEAIPHIVANIHYFVVEYDYKFCKYRSIELHQAAEDKKCDCHTQENGKIVSAFLSGAEKIFWMSEKQKLRYQQRFPFLTDEKSIILSSVFSVKDLEYIERLRKARNGTKINKEFIVLNSNSWIKGTQQTIKLLQDKKISHELVGGLQYNEMLRKLSEHKGLAFMPLGSDTCPRIVIEAKLLGLQLMINENVQHLGEEWFDRNINEIELYLLEGHNRFWDKIESFFMRDMKLSGYTTTYNVIKSNYPWRQCITSMLNFCDEVIVLDGGSNDGTWEELQTMSKLQGDGRLVVKQLKRNWDDPKFAIFDGQQKSVARTLCKYEWCWQMDVDEVVHELDYNKIKNLLRTIPKSTKIVSLPIFDYWGKNGKVRIDVTPWKWRLSKNDPHIAHGIKSDHIAYDSDGDMYSLGSDGCDYINIANFQTIQHTSFYTKELHDLRVSALANNREDLQKYANVINDIAKKLPAVHHYSWFDLKRKIYTYKNYWSKHWSSLYKRQVEDTTENNMFFEKPWLEVSDEEIKNLAIKMEKELGGWVFHERIDFSRPTPWLRLDSGHPSVMKDWIEESIENG